MASILYRVKLKGAAGGLWAATLVALLGLAGHSSVVLAADTVPLASPVSAESTGVIHPGKVVWADLITTDVAKASRFYAAVFDWSVSQTDDPGYVELERDGRAIASIVDYEDAEATAQDSRWLVSMSVPDVDAAVALAVAGGGALRHPVDELPGRGRYAVVEDSRGAMLMLLRATGGDPVDAPLKTGEWGWAELWTDDVEESLAFYTAFISFESRDLPDGKGGRRLLLGTENRARALIVELPWDDVEPNWLPYVPVASVPDTEQRIIDAGGAVLVASGDSDGAHDVAIVADNVGGVFAIQEVGGAR